ncbi:hypothetical protein [Kordiimonas sp.]|uniref:hypothetical protein n=1 Tax=Kordiimonas sp. TaxID=1970157 RepID=UPI003A901B83
MAFTLTPTTVYYGSDASLREVNSQETIPPGRAVTSDGYLADSEDEDKLDIAGVSINYSVSGKRLQLITLGELTTGDDLSANIAKEIVVTTEGKFEYGDELSSGQTRIRVGYVKSQYVIDVMPYNTGIEMPA